MREATMSRFIHNLEKQGISIEELQGSIGKVFALVALLGLSNKEAHLVSQQDIEALYDLTILMDVLKEEMEQQPQPVYS